MAPVLKSPAPWPVNFSSPLLSSLCHSNLQFLPCSWQLKIPFIEKMYNNLALSLSCPWHAIVCFPFCDQRDHQSKDKFLLERNFTAREKI